LAANTRPSALAIAPAAVLLIASAFLIFVSSHRLRSSRDLVVHTHEVIGTARLLFSGIQDAETGERGYVISQQPEYLEPYREAVARIPQLVARLRELTRKNPAQQKRLAELSREIDLKLAALGTTIEALARLAEKARAKIVGIFMIASLDQSVQKLKSRLGLTCQIESLVTLEQKARHYNF